MHYPYQGLKVRVRTDLERVGPHQSIIDHVGYLVYRPDYSLALIPDFRARFLNSPRERQLLLLEALVNEETYEWCDYRVHRADVVTVV